MQKTMVVFPCLPQDMITDILSRLPVKSLIRFQSVSKHWLSLITNPEFITAYLNHSTKNPSLLFAKSYKFSTKISLLRLVETITVHPVRIPRSMKDSAAFKKIYVTNPRRRSRIVIDIVGSCGGLLCIKINLFCREDLLYELCREDLQYALWNPATRWIKYIKLPQQAVDIRSEGFGYDSRINDYKMVRIGHFFHFPSFDSDSDSDDDLYGYRHTDRRKVDSIFRALVFSWRKDSWRVVEDWGLEEQYSLSYELSMKGEIYWMATAWDGPGRRDVKDDFILAFDMAMEIFRRIDLPCLYYPGRQITRFKDSLALFKFPRNAFFLYDPNRSFDLWVMDANEGGGYRENWTKLFTIRPVSLDYEGVRMWRDKIIMNSRDGLILLYDPISQEIIHLPIPIEFVSEQCFPIDFFRYKRSLYEYVESLTPVDATNNIVAEDASM